MIVRSSIEKEITFNDVPPLARTKALAQAGAEAEEIFVDVLANIDGAEIIEVEELYVAEFARLALTSRVHEINPPLAPSDKNTIAKLASLVLVP